MNTLPLHFRRIRLTILLSLFSILTSSASANEDCGYEVLLPKELSPERVFLVAPGPRASGFRHPEPKLQGPNDKRRHHDVPVFGDIHGNMNGLLSSIRNLQRSNDTQYPFVLQVGDLGFYPDPTRYGLVNKPARQNDTEMGVHSFLSNPVMHDKYFVKAEGCNQLDCKIVFVRGNHDDPMVREMEQNSASDLVPVDPYGRLHYLKDGGVAELQLDRRRRIGIVVGGYGGIDPRARPKAAEKEPGILFDPGADDKLLSAAGEVDVLMTHQGTTRAHDGSSTIDTLVSLTGPKLHVHGHSHQSTGPLMIDQTPSYGLNKMPAEKNPGVGNFVGFIRYYEDGTVEFVPAN